MVDFLRYLKSEMEVEILNDPGFEYTESFGVIGRKEPVGNLPWFVSSD